MQSSIDTTNVLDLMHQLAGELEIETGAVIEAICSDKNIGILSGDWEELLDMNEV